VVEVAQIRYELKSIGGPKRVEIVGTVIAGRSPESDLVLSDGHPSRRHAQLMIFDDKVWVEDLGSANGTFVNGEEIKARTALALGDRVRFDTEEYELREIIPVDANATQVRRTPPPPEATPAPPPASSTPGGRARTPGSWADPDFRGGQGTRVFDPAELEKIRGGVAAPQGPVDSPHLVVQTGRRGGERIRLRPGKETNVWEIGSETGRDIVLDDVGVSGFHAKIVNEGNRWKLLDQMSANGSFVNGQKSNISYLKDGDRLRFGPVECLFQLPRGTGGTRADDVRMSPWLLAAIAFVATAGLIVGAFLLFR
jgi:pSer/pThr/pTyr-binding forkhead associated (FHA) protein